MKRTFVMLLAVYSMAALLSQTRLNQRQLVNTPERGLLLSTDEGLKTVTPTPGYSWIVGNPTAQLLSNYCTAAHVIGEVPLHLPDAPLEGTVLWTPLPGETYSFHYRPNPAIVAVYLNGLRLLNERDYQLVWMDPNQLPDRVRIFAAKPGDVVLVDYVIGQAPLPGQQ